LRDHSLLLLVVALLLLLRSSATAATASSATASLLLLRCYCVALALALRRELFTSFYLNSQINVNPEWFIGFLEGEGTFGIKTGSSLYFQVAQKNTSVESLNAIIIFLTNLKANQLNKESKILPLNVVSTINKKN